MERHRDKNPDHVFANAEDNNCLDAQEIDGERFVRISEDYIEKLEGIGASLKCMLNIETCTPFGRPEGSSFDDGSAQEIALEAGGSAAQRMLSHHNRVRQEQAEVTEFHENVLAAIRERTRTDSGKVAIETSYDEIKAVTQGLIAMKVFDMRKGLAKGAQKKIKMLFKGRATQLFTEKNKEVANAIVDVVKEMATDRSMLRRIARGRGTRDAQQIASRLEDIASTAAQISPAEAGIAARATGYLAGAVAFIGVGIAMEGVPMLLDISDGEKDHGLIESYDRCDGSLDSVTPGRASKPWNMTNESPYYDSYRAVFKNEKSKENDKDCRPMLWVNFMKFQNLASVGKRLVVDHTLDPDICAYVDTMAKRLKVSAIDQKAKNPKITCKKPLASDLQNRRRSVKVEFDSDLVSSFLLGSPVDFDYALDAEGRYKPSKISSPEGFQPAIVKRMDVRFREVNLSPHIRPVDFYDRGLSFKRQSYQQKCLLKKSLWSMNLCWNNYKDLDGSSGSPSADFGRTSNIEICTQNIKAPRVFRRGCFPPERGSKNALFTTEKGLEDYFEGPDPSEKMKELMNAQKQFAGYSEMVLSRSRFLNRAIAEAGYCCQQQGLGWPAGESQRDQCKAFYRIEEPETVTPEELPTAQ